MTARAIGAATRPPEAASPSAPPSSTTTATAIFGSSAGAKETNHASLDAALLARAVPGRPLQLARYYVLVTAAPAVGLWDSLRHGVSAGWEKAEGTR
jgi:hypothetical protein